MLLVFQEEALGWIAALRQMIAKKAPPFIDLPAPPPPPPIQSADSSYETIDDFTKLHYGEYMQINARSREAPATYATPPPPSPQQGRGKTPQADVLKQSYLPDKVDSKAADTDPRSAEPVPLIVEEKQFEAEARKRAFTRSEKRLSKKYSVEQLEILRRVVDLEIANTTSDSPFYDDVVSCRPSSPQPFEQEGAWGTDVDNYVDMKKIDNTYDTIPEPPKENFYFNIDDKPPLPPKRYVGHKSPQKFKPGAQKPALLQKPRHVSQPSSFGEDCVLTKRLVSLYVCILQIRF